MSKLIDAEKLDFISYQGIPNGYKNSFDSGILYAMNLIDDQPTIDAVPVVRCKDCKFAHLTYDGKCKYCDAWSDDGSGEQLYLDGDFYCSFGEKVTE